MSLAMGEGRPPTPEVIVGPSRHPSSRPPPGPLEGAQRLHPKPLLQDWDTKGWQFVLLFFVLLFSCSLAGLVAADVMALLGRLLPFL
jgi:hypothetical protein